MGFKHFAHLTPSVTKAILDDPGLRVIHLRRENLLAQFSSEALARASDRWVARVGEDRDQRRVDFDAAAFEAFEAYQTRIDAERLDAYGRAGTDVLMLDYVALSDPATIGRLSRFLGVRLRADAAIDTARQNRAVIRDRFTDPDAVRAYLAGRGRAGWGEDG